jgi:hypothetical protein
MRKFLFVIFLFVEVLLIKGQCFIDRFDVPDTLNWVTFVCGSINNSDAPKAQTIGDSLRVTPNPFQKRTVVYFSFAQNDTVSLTVLNLLGQTVLTVLTNSVMISGNHQDSLIMDSYPDGIYFVLLTLGHRKTINKKIIKSSTAGIEEINFSSEIKIYPNPTSNTLHISTEQNEFENSEIEITNSLGQMVLKTLFSNTVDVSNFSQGFYNLKIATLNKQIYNSKFIKE